MASRIEGVIDELVLLVRAIAPTASVSKDLFPIFNREKFEDLQVVLSPSDQNVEIESRSQSFCKCEVDLVICKNTVDRSEIGTLLELRESIQNGLLRQKAWGMVLYAVDTQGANSIINNAIQISKNTFITTLKLQLKGIIDV